MSAELLGKFERMSLSARIELTLRFYPDAQPELLRTDQEPYQSFDLLRQIRNFLVHYVPERELVWSSTGEHIANMKNLEKRLTGKYALPSLEESPNPAISLRLHSSIES